MCIQQLEINEKKGQPNERQKEKRWHTSKATIKAQTHTHTFIERVYVVNWNHHKQLWTPQTWPDLRAYENKQSIWTTRTTEYTAHSICLLNAYNLSDTTNNTASANRTASMAVAAVVVIIVAV